MNPVNNLSIYGVSKSKRSSVETRSLPQTLGDHLYWNEKVSQTLQVYQSSPANEQAQICIFTVSYGEASTINFLGKNKGLSVVISGSNN